MASGGWMRSKKLRCIPLGDATKEEGGTEEGAQREEWYDG